MDFFISLAIVLMVLILPIKMAATWVGAEKTGIFHCIIALIVAASIQKGFALLLTEVSTTVGVMAAILLSAVAYMFVLGTTFLQAVIIAIVQGVLMTIIITLLAEHY